METGDSILDAKESERGGSQTLGRGLQVAALIMQSNLNGLSMTEIAEALGIKKSTVHRLLTELTEHGLVSRDVGKRYRLGRFAYEMGIVSTPSYDLRSLCEGSMNRIAEATGDTVFLGKRCGSSALCIDHRIGPDVRPPIVPPRGFVHPLGVGSIGLAFLSRLSDEQVRAINEANKARLRFYRLSQDVVLTKVAQSRALGFSKMGSCVASGVVALGISIDDEHGRPLLAMSVAAPQSRMSRHHQSCALDALHAEAKVVQARIPRSRLPADTF